MGTGTRQEATPLVYDGVMYVPGPGDVIQAIDAKTGDLLWEYRRKLPEGVNGGTNRNIAIWGNTLIDAQRRQSDLRASTRRPASWCGKRRCSMPKKRAPRERRARSSPTAR